MLDISKQHKCFLLVVCIMILLQQVSLFALAFSGVIGGDMLHTSMAVPALPAQPAMEEAAETTSATKVG